MAMSRCLVRLFSKCIKDSPRVFSHSVSVVGLSSRWLSDAPTKQSLLSPAWLKINNYMKTRETILETSLTDVKEAFISRMEEYLSDPDNGVSSDDMRWILYAAQTEQELDLAVRMFVRFEQQRDKTVAPSFRFDPVMMRLCHFMQKPDIAYQLIKDKNVTDAIQTDAAFVTLMDLLYWHEQYDRLIEVMDIHSQRATIAHRPLAWGCLFLTYASLWKQNTAESYLKLKKLWTLNRKLDAPGSPRAVALAAHMALKQSEPEIAWEYLETVAKNRSTLVASLKVLTLTALNQQEKAVEILRSILPDPSQDHRFFIARVAVNELVDLVNSGANQDLKDTMSTLVKELETNNCLNNRAIEDALLKPLSPPNKNPRDTAGRNNNTLRSLQS